MRADYLPDFNVTGRLEELSLPVLMAHLLDRKLTGTLHMKTDTAANWIFFSQGFPAGTGLPDSPNHLGAILQELGFIDDGTYHEALMELTNAKRPLGFVLIDKKKITSDQLEQAVAVQMIRTLTRLFEFKNGVFQFFEDEEPPFPFFPVRINPYALMYNGIRNSYNEGDLTKGLAKLNGKSCRLAHLFIERREFFDFSPDENRDLELLREFRLPQEYVRMTQSGPTVGMMLLLTLLSCGMIELEEVSFAQPLAPVPGQADNETPVILNKPDRAAMSTSASSSTRAPTRGRTVSLRAAGAGGFGGGVGGGLRKKVFDKYEQIKSADLWGILEVEKNADIEKVKKSYMTLAKVYHPDRVAEANDEELTHRMKVIFGRISEAFQILSQPEKRDALLKESTAGSDKKVSARPEEASLQFQKALIYLKKRDLSNATECIRWALELDPNNGEYQAYRFWIDYQKGTGPEAERIGKLKTSLLDVAKRVPECFAAMRFLSLIFSKLNDQVNYEQYLLKAQKINPKDIDVAREIRLISMRKQQSKGKGLFGLTKK